MKNSLVGIVLLIILMFSGCTYDNNGKNSEGQQTATVSTQNSPTFDDVTIPNPSNDNSAENTNSYSSPEVEDDTKDYDEIGSELVTETINYLFGGNSIDSIINTLGEPIKKEVMSGFTRWFFKQGVEIDIVDQNDIPTVFNYVYIDSSSDIKIDRGIGIGSSSDDVIKEYANEYNQKDSNNHMIVLGARYGGILLIIDDSKVSSIYVAMGAYTGVTDPREIK